MTDDFETVREALQGVFVTSSDEDEAFDKGNAALDRLESRLREAEEALRQVEANRDSLLLRVEETEDLLREEREQWHRQDESFRSQIRGLTAARDRLRADYTAVKAAHDANAKMHGQAVAYHDAMRRAQDEADQLRKDLENCHADYMQADAECDRLRGEYRVALQMLLDRGVHPYEVDDALTAAGFPNPAQGTSDE